MSKPTVRILHLHLKGKYFDEIRAGRKKVEYRLASTWRKRLQGKQFDEIHLYRGYPKRGAGGTMLYRKWNGYREDQIIHPHFGSRGVDVLEIDVSIPLD
jgi:hypothetical protein